MPEMTPGGLGNRLILCMAAAVLAAIWAAPAAGLEADDAAGNVAPPSALEVVTAGTLADATYVGSDTTPTVSVTVAEPGGTVTLYSDRVCSEPISSPVDVAGAGSPYVVDVEVGTDLAVGLHTIHARHTVSQQTSECSSEKADYRVIPPMAATYRVTFTGAFTTGALAPGVGVPGGAHFTTLIGAVHNNGVVFWERGGVASEGTEIMAETGRTGELRSEVVASGPDASEIIRQPLVSGGTPVAGFDIMVSGGHASVTLASMVAPSPDWFVGVSGLPLLGADGAWIHHGSVELFPYDAGTEDGGEFSLNNGATVPHQTITSLRDTGKFSDKPIAILQFERVALASNLAQESGPGALFLGHNPDVAAQGFHTGPNPGGYVLHSVTASFGDKAGSPGDLRVRIHADDAGSPGMPVGMLSGGNPDAAGLYTFAADGGIRLDAGTGYYVAFDVADPVPGSAYRLLFTGSDAEDSGAAPGWSIADTLLGHVHDANRDNSWKISIQGEAAAP